jgi:hypothetical protein
MSSHKSITPRPATIPRRALTTTEFSQLADVPPETEWFANIDNPHTRRAYRNDLKEFMTFTGVRTPIELRLITRAHVIAWRKDLDHRQLAPGSIRRKLSALSSLYDFLTDWNAVPVNPVKGVKRPKVDGYEGKDRRSRASRHRRHQRPRSQCGHRQSARMARTREHRDHPHLRPAKDEARGLTHL